MYTDERKIDFAGIENLHHDHFVPLEPEVLHTLQEPLLVIKEIADHDNDSLALDLASHPMKDRGKASSAKRLKPGKSVHDPEKVIAIVAAREVFLDLFIKDSKCHGISLMKNEIGKAGRHHLAVLQFADLPRAVFHALAAIKQEVRDKIGLLLILLDVIALRLGLNLPIEVPYIITWSIFPMLGKLYGEAPVWGFVLPRHVTLHNEPCIHSQSFRPGDSAGIKKFSGFGVHG